jgi:hypothetical protein
MRSLRGAGLLRLVALAGIIVQMTFVTGHFHNSSHAEVAVHQLCHDAPVPLSAAEPCPQPSEDEGGDSCQFCWAMAAAGMAVSADIELFASPQLNPVAGACLSQDFRGDLFISAAFEARGPPSVRLI